MGSSRENLFLASSSFQRLLTFPGSQPHITQAFTSAITSPFLTLILPSPSSKDCDYSGSTETIQFPQLTTAAKYLLPGKVTFSWAPGIASGHPLEKTFRPPQLWTLPSPFLFLARKGCVKFPWKIVTEISEIPLSDSSTSLAAPVVCSQGWAPSHASTSWLAELWGLGH